MVRSLNRARVMVLPGLQVDDGVLGTSGYDLLSAEALRQELVRSASILDLDPDVPDLIRQFEACFHNPQTRPLALQIARAYGRRLGYFLLMLKRADAGNRVSRPEWSDAHWAFWQSVKHIYVGGGRLAGQLGRHAVEAAQELLAEQKVNLTVELAAHPAHLALLGLARAAPGDINQMLVLDFGHTAIKRGLALYKGQWLAQLSLWPNLPTVCDDIHQTEYTLDRVRQRWQGILKVIKTSWDELPVASNHKTALGISLSCYLVNGHPSPGDKGCYGCLQLLTEHLETFIQRELADHLRPTPALVLMHDGTAAATFYAGSEYTVVLTFGTAIGNGFPPTDDDCRPIHPHFQLDASG